MFQYLWRHLNFKQCCQACTGLGAVKIIVSWGITYTVWNNACSYASKECAASSFRTFEIFFTSGCWSNYEEEIGRLRKTTVWPIRATEREDFVQVSVVYAWSKSTQTDSGYSTLLRNAGINFLYWLNYYTNYCTYINFYKFYICAVVGIIIE